MKVSLKFFILSLIVFSSVGICQPNRVISVSLTSIEIHQLPGVQYFKINSQKVGWFGGYYYLSTGLQYSHKIHIWPNPTISKAHVETQNDYTTLNVGLVFPFKHEGKLYWCIGGGIYRNGTEIHRVYTDGLEKEIDRRIESSFKDINFLSIGLLVDISETTGMKIPVTVNVSLNSAPGISLGIGYKIPSLVSLID